MSILEELTRSQLKAWNYILEYARATGKRCFTYNSLQRYWPRASTHININTLERRIRELVELGVLSKNHYIDRRGRRRVFFCIDPGFWEELSGR